MDNDLRKKYETLISIIKSMGKICVAFSGGIDSTLLLKIARDTLGVKRVLAVTAVSDTFTESERNRAASLANTIGAKQIIMKTSEADDPQFTENTPERCYHCKKNFYQELVPIAHAHGFAIICGGSNTDDLNDYRPGEKAGKEFGIRSPLIEAGIGKKEIRALYRETGLPEWDRPSNSCLASRIPYGEKITAEKLSAIEKSEEYIHSLGFRIVRVRHHGEIARIEVPADDIPGIMDSTVRQKIANRLKELGFSWVSLDIEGYRMGSMNEILKDNAPSQL